MLLKYSSILLQPDWYVQLEPILREYYYDYPKTKIGKPKEWFDFRDEFTALIAYALDNRKIFLATTGFNEDKERKPIDTIVIHHSSTTHESDLSKIDALGLLRLYTYQYNTNKEYKGKPIWSNHFFNRRQTFIAYHYIVKRSGRILHTLDDESIGWQAGNWDYNCRSIAICFLDNLSNSLPTKEAINSAKLIIKKYGDVKILGHSEINKTASCPGEKFYGDDGWKNSLT